MTNLDIKSIYKYAEKAYKASDQGRWVFAFWANMVVGKYERGGTIGLADKMGVSTDTVEDHAHAFSIYNELRSFEGGKFSRYVHQARCAPYIYISHFRALYDARERYKLTLRQVISILVDIVQNEGSISSRNVDTHTRDKYGDTRDWTYYGQKAMKEIHKTLGQPDLPKDVRKALQGAYEKLGEKA